MFGWLRRFFSSPGNAARAAAGSGDSQPNGNSNSASGTAAPPGEAPGFLQEIQARLERARWHFKLRFIPSEAYKFWEVQPEERDEVNQARALRNRPPANDDLVGLAFSGGGIRSATFNLGIVQGLAERDYLRQIDYTSTISGGGYIGSWLVSWIRRVGFEKVQQRLAENRQAPPPHEPQRYLEPTQIRALRQYSNYLTPRAGVLSTDTWAALAVYERNLILNLVVLIASGVAVLLLPDFALWSLKAGELPSAGHLIGIAAAMTVLAMTVVGLGFGALSKHSSGLSAWRRHIVSHAAIYTAGPLFIAAISTCVLLGYWYSSSAQNRNSWILYGGLLYLIPWLFTVIGEKSGKTSSPPKPVQGGLLFRWLFRWLFPWCITLMVGALQGFMMYEVWRLFHCLNPEGNAPNVPLTAGRVAIVVFGPAILVAPVLMLAVFHMGLAGLSLADAKREWLARAAAILTLVSLSWIVAGSATAYGPLLMKYLTVSHWANAEWGQVFKWVLGFGWLSTTGAGLIAGRSAASGGKTDGRFKIITRVAPPVFAIGLVVLLSYGLDFVLPSGNQAQTGLQAARRLGYSIYEINQQYWARLDSHLGYCLFVAFGISLFVALVLGNRVDVNEFSMHLFYRNRLVRAYLGATVFDRRPDPFIGFSAKDDLPLTHFTTNTHLAREPIDSSDHPDPKKIEPYDGPYPIFGTALNLVRGKELAWQQRKAASFVYTPLYCGYDYFSTENKANFSNSAYRPTDAFGRSGGPHLGTAVAISGAAASPNMGYHTNPALAFLMAVFNVRLGWWTVNPRHKTLWRVRSTPSLGLLYLFREMFPSTNDEMR